jgi:hypothetical protein
MARILYRQQLSAPVAGGASARITVLPAGGMLEYRNACRLLGRKDRGRIDRLVSNGARRANFDTTHAGDVTGCLDGNCVKGRDERRALQAYGHARAALDAGGPVDIKRDRLRLLQAHTFLNFDSGPK